MSHRLRSAHQVRHLKALLLGAVIAAGGWWVLHRDPADRPMPTDDEVRALWRAHRGEFEALRAMLDADPGHQVVGEDRVDQCWYFENDDEWSCPDARARDVTTMLKVAGLPADRYAVYRRHLSAVGGRRAERRDDGFDVLLFAAGIVTSGVTKSVVWMPKPPKALVADTDRDRPASYTTNYAAIADGWYVEHSSN